MPAILVGKREFAGTGSPLSWRPGEITSVREQDAAFGWFQMPITQLGQFTVAQVNSNQTIFPTYSAILMADGGTITKGSTPVDVIAGDAIVWRASFFPDGSVDPAGWYFKNYGQRADTPDVFFHIRITDRTTEQVSVYLEEFNKKVIYESLQYDPQTHQRRVKVTNEYVTASGDNGFTDDGTQAVVDAWSGTRVSWDIYQFTMDAILPPEDYEAFRVSTEQLAFEDLYKRRRWYIDQAGLDALEVNNWAIAGTADEVGPYLRDGLLD